MRMGNWKEGKGSRWDIHCRESRYRSGIRGINKEGKRERERSERGVEEEEDY